MADIEIATWEENILSESSYNKIADAIRGTKYGVQLVNILDKAIVIITILIYGIILLMQLISASYAQLYKYILIPAAGFLVVSVFRYLYNQPRPYQELDINPILKKDTQGKSFPSRHVYSIFIIAMTALQYNVVLGILLLIFGTILAVVRVVGGAHFPRDVFAGGLLGVVTGLLGYYMIMI
ncbi:MAG: phosphatase PAP2 family protein [Lachnospiraceae bacterium]|nr:phosphatase PAP2 family protein [Lachnospiraceae bacterium]